MPGCVSVNLAAAFAGGAFLIWSADPATLAFLVGCAVPFRAGLTNAVDYSLSHAGRTGVALILCHWILLLQCLSWMKDYNLIIIKGRFEKSNVFSGAMCCPVKTCSSAGVHIPGKERQAGNAFLFQINVVQIDGQGLFLLHHKKPKAFNPGHVHGSTLGRCCCLLQGDAQVIPAGFK